MIIYIATNIETGDVIEGEAHEIAKRLNTSRNTIYNALSSKRKIHSIWVITKNVAYDNPYRFPQVLLEEWDRVTEPFKHISKLRRAGVT